MKKIEVYDIEANWLEQYAEKNDTTVAEVVEEIIYEKLLEDHLNTVMSDEKKRFSNASNAYRFLINSSK